jgi:hypothetical protein
VPANSPSTPRTTDSHPSARPHTPSSAESGAPPPASPSPSDAEHWLAELEHSLDAAEKAKLVKMKAGKTPQQTRDMLGGDPSAARERVRSELRLEHERAAVAAQSKLRVTELRKQIAELGLLDDPDVHAIIEGTTVQNWKDRISMLRDKLMSRILRSEAQQRHPGYDVVDGAKIYERVSNGTLEQWRHANPGQDARGLTDRADGLFMQRGEIDLMILERQAGKKAKIIEREEIKTGIRDKNADARSQLLEQASILSEAAAGRRQLRIEVEGQDITNEIDLATDAMAGKHTRGPAGKGFDRSLGATANDLEAVCKDLLPNPTTERKIDP